MSSEQKYDYNSQDGNDDEKEPRDTKHGLLMEIVKLVDGCSHRLPTVDFTRQLEKSMPEALDRFEKHASGVCIKAISVIVKVYQKWLQEKAKAPARDSASKKSSASGRSGKRRRGVDTQTDKENVRSAKRSRSTRDQAEEQAGDHDANDEQADTGGDVVFAAAEDKQQQAEGHQVPESSAEVAPRDDEDQTMEPEKVATGKQDKDEAMSAPGTVQVQEAESEAPMAIESIAAAAAAAAPASVHVAASVNGSLGTANDPDSDSTPALPNSRRDGHIELTLADDDRDRSAAHSFAEHEQGYMLGTAPASQSGMHGNEPQTPPEQQLRLPSLDDTVDSTDLPLAVRYDQAGMLGTASALGVGYDPSHAGTYPFRSPEHSHAQFSASAYASPYYPHPMQLHAAAHANGAQTKKQTTGDERAAVLQHFTGLFKNHFHGPHDYPRTEFKNIGQVQRSVKDMLDQVKDRKRLAARVKTMKPKQLIEASNRADACTEQTSLYRHYYCGVLRRQIKEAKQYPDWKTCCQSFGAGGSVSVVNAQIAFANLVDAGNEWLLDVDFRCFRWQKFKDHTPAIFDALRSAGFRAP